ncbi:MAG: N-acetylglucosamine-6-phosphate deacetylase [Clostridiales bacterium]|nr:N-acetylglucosamine-6-phosphate deacetylase [Clostridiales bacterium]
MIIRNGLVFTNECLVKCDIAFENGIITAITPVGRMPGIGFEAEGAYVLPGLVDIHAHGCLNSDFCDADAAGLEKMLAYFGRQGVTGVVLATMSLPEEVLADVIRTALPYINKAGYGAILRGIHMEGPFISREKRGAQNPDHIAEPDIDFFDRLYALSQGSIRLFSIAPELPGSPALISHAAKCCRVSLAHSDADYDCAVSAFEAGASHVTHLFNAMSALNHRTPGLVGAAFDHAACVEVISDGVHLHPSVVRAIFSMFGARRICLISDSTRGTGMPDGEYELGGQAIHIHDGHSNLVKDGTIAGSAMHLADCFRQAIRFGIHLEDAIQAASGNPACAASIDLVTGSISPGKSADMLILDADLQVQAVFAGGVRVDDKQH